MNLTPARKSHSILLIAIVVAVALFSGCAAPGPLTPPTPAAIALGTGAPGARTPSATADYWPTEGWRTAEPAAHNVDAARLAAMTDYIKLKGLDIKSVVVIRDGYIVFEHYGPGQGPDSRGEVFSVTKSFASTLIGIAQRKGLLGGLDERVLALLPGDYANVDPAKEGMTLEDVLTMRSGLGWTEDDATIGDFYTASDPLAFILDLPVTSEPGTAFNYCTGCSHLLTAIAADASAMEAQAFAEQELFGPLGIRRVEWLTDRNGQAMGGWGLQLSAREMAKLGYLYLRGGTWDGREIITPEWVAAATSRHTSTDSPHGHGYGYQWWTHAKFSAYMALGRGGQIVYVRPDKNLVVAMRADLPNHDAIYELIETYLEPAVKN